MGRDIVAYLVWFLEGFCELFWVEVECLSSTNAILQEAKQLLEGKRPGTYHMPPVNFGTFPRLPTPKGKTKTTRRRLQQDLSGSPLRIQAAGSMRSETKDPPIARYETSPHVATCQRTARLNRALLTDEDPRSTRPKRGPAAARGSSV